MGVVKTMVPAGDSMKDGLGFRVLISEEMFRLRGVGSVWDLGPCFG